MIRRVAVREHRSHEQLEEFAVDEIPISEAGPESERRATLPGERMMVMSSPGQTRPATTNILSRNA